jgi:diguanylate cyclase (GGDEF)-like protein/putative nucleotidyltransferase with HDIG domain
VDESNLYALANELGEPILVVDGRGVVAMASDRAAELAGVLPGTRFRDLFSNPVDADALIANASASSSARVMRRRGDDAALFGCRAFRLCDHVVVHLCAGGVADMRAIAANVDDALFCEELAPDGSRRSLFFGGGARALLGEDVLAAANPAEAWDAAIVPGDRAARAAAIEEVRSGRRATVEYHLVDARGVPRLLYERSWPDTSCEGRLLRHGVVADITAQRETIDALNQLAAEISTSLAMAESAHVEADAARQEAERLSRTDALTGIANRRNLTEQLEKELARSERDGSAPGVLLLDVDHFKRINDRFGHAAGDAVLVEVARRIESAVRTYDHVARWGGEEFCVVAPGLMDDAPLLRISEAIRAAVARSPIDVGGGTILSVTISTGAARATTELASAEAVTHAADRALYSAKRRGRNQTRLFASLTRDDLIAEEPESIRIAQGLALAGSVREAIPPLHCDQVAELAGAIATELGLPSDVSLVCRLGGWLHDVGKVAIPDAIIHKGGSLDEPERRVLRRHAEIGEQIIVRIPALKEASRAVRHHHERYDGSGYPDGLAGDAIPIEARIVAVADTFSAITAGRAYQPALEQDAALEQLRLSAGRALDPAVVAALSAVIQRRRRGRLVA